MKFYLNEIAPKGEEITFFAKLPTLVEWISYLHGELLSLEYRWAYPRSPWRIKNLFDGPKI